MSCALCVSLAILALVLVFKIYYKLTTKWNNTYVSLVGKTAIVTGCNTGIGYITALNFAMRGARVILACRSKQRAEDAQKKIIQATGNENVVVKLIDMESFDSVRAFAKDVNATEEKIDILVNNVGAFYLGNEKTKDGLQPIMQVNHFSPFLLTHLLIDKLKKSAPSRIVNVASLAATASHYDPDDMNKFPKYAISYVSEWLMYANSKLCNILFTTELAKKLDGTGVTANCLHPGIIRSEFSRNMPNILKTVHDFLNSFFFMSQEEGAQTTIQVALAKELDGVSGKLFANCEKIGIYRVADDVGLAKKTWKNSEEFVKLAENEKI